MTRKAILASTTFLFFLVSPLFMSTPAFSLDKRNDADFLEAREAFRKGDAKRLQLLKAKLGDHPLVAYIEGYDLRLWMDNDNTEAIQKFLQKNENSVVAERLRLDWLDWLGKRKRFSEVEAEYAKLTSPDSEATCFNWQARLASQDQPVLDEIKAVWLTMLEPVDACQESFHALVAADRINPDDVWQRARRQVEINRPIAARQTLGYLPESQMPSANALNEALNNAAAYLAKLPANAFSSRTSRELASFALQRLSLKDPREADEKLRHVGSRLEPSQKEWLWGQIALQGAKRHLPEAVGWYVAARQATLSDENQEWRVRAALRSKNWQRVKQWIEVLPAHLSARPEWIYWLGRAYLEEGKKVEADALFSRIAGQPHFYGNLADEEQGKAIALPPTAASLTDAEKRVIQQHPALQRALVFFQLDMRVEGMREWNFALRGMGDEELLAAAELAKENHIWDRAINTADRTKEKHDYRLRFLSPYDDEIRPVAREQALDEAWVYGLMRQESRFVTSARSSVGASGLMQLMPATAKWVARKIGMTDFHHGRVNERDVNVRLGTSYMRLVLASLADHPVLASAAYNAGPGRARRWMAESPLEGAIYAETIPFPETRDYVKKVMSNTLYYGALFHGNVGSLKDRLGTIPSKTDDAAIADLP